MKLKFTGIIPARYESTRFPGKPLALINGIPMVVRVWERSLQALDDVFIATDHQDIYNTAIKAGAKVIFTSSKHETGTDRIAEASLKIFNNENYTNKVVLNIQGDEPMITGEAISSLCKAFNNEEVKIATLIREFENQDEFKNPNRPKVIIDKKNDAIAFSRVPLSGASINYQHIGVYAFRLTTLLEISKLKPTPGEKSERLEQIRWLDNSYSIRCVKTGYDGLGIDCPEDLEALKNLLEKNQDNSEEK